MAIYLLHRWYISRCSNNIWLLFLDSCAAIPYPLDYYTKIVSQCRLKFNSQLISIIKINKSWKQTIQTFIHFNKRTFERGKCTFVPALIERLCVTSFFLGWLYFQVAKLQPFVWQWQNKPFANLVTALITVIGWLYVYYMVNTSPDVVTIVSRFLWCHYVSCTYVLCHNSLQTVERFSVNKFNN